ncbi:hypothetical protein [Morganella psychrotolerans]|uniref:Uncharacterized protein n=1 Tax=Morganella psychrotolerans TaxID=368603 RepID=A0A1B8HQL8_9GAMM|nr:hypothetical protein [Morganella psychrotolerans]OBU11732.1 hypothetical protein AYY17_03245 [Morganella psychrotolerans]
MELKNTPAPWAILDDIECNHSTASETYHHIGAGKWFHDDYSNTGFGLSGYMSIHDARLITAAPDLLEALIELRKLVAHHDQADAAINKALGNE